jgi:hypothetical protein
VHEMGCVHSLRRPTAESVTTSTTSVVPRVFPMSRVYGAAQRAFTLDIELFRALLVREGDRVIPALTKVASCPPDGADERHVDLFTHRFQPVPLAVIETYTALHNVRVVYMLTSVNLSGVSPDQLTLASSLLTVIDHVQSSVWAQQPGLTFSHRMLTQWTVQFLAKYSARACVRGVQRARILDVFASSASATATSGKPLLPVPLAEWCVRDVGCASLSSE